MSRTASLIASGVFAGVCAALLSGCSSPVDEVAQQIDLPAVWTITPEFYEGPDKGIAEAQSGFELREDGTAELKNMPVGTSRVVDSYKCFDPSGSTYSGEASWKATSSGLLELSSDGETVMWADQDHFGSFDWVPLSLADCNNLNKIFYGGTSLYGKSYRTR